LERDGINVVLFATPAELGFSERASNACRMLGATCLGDVVQLTAFELFRLPNTGRKTVREIQEKLESFGLHLGMNLPGWSEVNPTSVRSTAKIEIRHAIRQLELGIDDGRAASLQDEIRNALSKVCQDRNLALVLTLWGLDGTERKTLEQVGQAYRMTRERVRQIEAKAIGKLQVRWHDVPLLDAALRTLEQNGPVAADDVSTILRKSAVPSSFVSAAAILKAAEVFEKQHDVAISPLSSARVVGRPEMLKMLRRATNELRRTTQSSGCTSLTRIQFRLSGSIEGSSNLRRGFEMLDEVVWLDEGRTWLYSKRPARNRLYNLLQKIFTVTNRMHVNELRQAVSRPHRMKYVPPAGVLSAFCNARGFSRSEENEIASAHTLSAELGDLDGAFVRAFRSLGSPLTREELEDYCVDEEGMKVSSFFQRLTYCPLFLRLAPGVYGLVGAPTPPGSVEAAKQRIRVDHIPPQHGWTSEGRLWVVLRLSRASAHSGAFFAPSFVNEHAEGLWTTTLADGTPIGTMEIKQGIANGLRDEFELLAADAGDFCLLQFDLTKNSVSVQVGGPDLEDQATQAEPSEADDTDSDEFDESCNDAEDEGHLNTEQI
jgi:hypothetical protein